MLSRTDNYSKEAILNLQDQQVEGILRKMQTDSKESCVQYALRIATTGGNVDCLAIPDQSIFLQVEWLGKVCCLGCGREGGASFASGYCYPCSKGLARCDICVLDPVRCHYDAGTCREPSWGDVHCNIPHLVYLASGAQVKVGLTRLHQQRTRWMDQGATQAVGVLEVHRRYYAGQIENWLRRRWSDRTDWRKMVTGQDVKYSLSLLRQDLRQDTEFNSWLTQAECTWDVKARWIEDPETSFAYPVRMYPAKAKSLNLVKERVISGTLLGVRGQYLLLDTGVFNVRKYEGYVCRIKICP